MNFPENLQYLKKNIFVYIFLGGGNITLIFKLSVNREHQLLALFLLLSLE